jgi:hypothetical protein
MGNNGSSAATVNDSSIEQPTKTVIDPATRDLIDRLLLERISLAGIARATQVSEQWLQAYVNEKYAQYPGGNSSSAGGSGIGANAFASSWGN